MVALPLFAFLLAKPPESRFERNLLSVAEDITATYFRDFGCVVHVTEGVAPVPPPPKNSSVVLVNLNASFAAEALEAAYRADCRGFVVRVRDRSAVADDLVRAYKKSDVNRYNNRRYLFLPRGKGDANASLSPAAAYFMPDAAFVVTRSDGFDVLAHTFFDGHKHDVLGQREEVLDAWREETGFERGVDLYPRRLDNLRGKRIVLAMMHYSPYALVLRDGFDGLETRIAAEYARLKNATWTGLDHPVHLWGDIFDNGTGNGAIGSVYEHKADIGFSAIYQWHCDVLECSYPYIYAGVTCLVPRPRPLSGWYTIVLPFESRVWLAVLSLYVVASVFVFGVSVVVHRLRHGRRASPVADFLLECFFGTFRVQLQQWSRRSDAHRDASLSAFYKAWTAYSFFVAVSWQSGIASFLTVPRYEDAIDDVGDLASRWPRIEWGANHVDWTKSIAQTTEPVLVDIVRRFRVLGDAELRRRVATRDFAFFMERLPNGHYGLNDYVDEDAMKHLRIMRGNIYTANCVMILPKCSPYLESLDKMLFRMFDSGLMQKMEVQISLERINNRLQNMIRTSSDVENDHENMALLVTHVLGAIYIFACGATLSAIVFAAEVARGMRAGASP